MNVAPTRISKVELDNFNFKRDIAIRTLISSLNTFQLEILREIVYSSLKFSLDELCASLNVDPKLIDQFLKNLSEVGLLKIERGTVFVDKDMRRYFEFQLSKFDDSFEPNMEYVQTLLQQVPIHVLPLWYSLPKNTDDIFGSIIEKNLSTPKIYSKYLQELPFENEKQEGIVRDVLNSKDLSLTTAFLKKKYQLDDKEFLESILYLEYSLACFCIFAETEHGFEERVVPLHEWKTWLQFQSDTICPALNEALVERIYPSDWGFIDTMTEILTELNSANKQTPEYTKLASLLFIEEKNGVLKATPSGKEWLLKKPQEKGMMLYLNTMNRLRRQEGRYTDKDIRGIEKSLKRILKTGWVLLDDFLKGMYACIGESGPVSITKKGKKWSFAVPTYKEDDRQFISDTIMRFMCEAGITAIGQYKGKPCFMLTPFGRMVIGD